MGLDSTGSCTGWRNLKGSLAWGCGCNSTWMLKQGQRMKSPHEEDACNVGWLAGTSSAFLHPMIEGWPSEEKRP